MDKQITDWIINNWYFLFVVLYVLSSIIITIITKIRKNKKVSVDDIIACINLAELSIPGAGQGVTKKDFAINLLQKRFKLSSKDLDFINSKIDELCKLSKDLNINKGE